MKYIKMLVLGLASLLVGAFRGETFALANEAETTRPASHWKRKTAMAIGRPDMATAPDDDLDAAHDAHMTALANEMADMPPGPEEATGGADNERHETEGQKAARLEKEKADKEKADGLANELAAARKESIDVQIGAAIEAGRILPADKPAWEAKFANDYASAKGELAQVTGSKLKTKAKTENLGAESTTAMANEQERQEAVQALVNEAMADGTDYETAWSKVKRDPKNKALFETMKKKPEAAK